MFTPMNNNIGQLPDEVLDFWARVGEHFLHISDQDVPPAVSETQIASFVTKLPALTQADVEAADNKPDPCPICLDEFKAGETDRCKLPCGHLFHFEKCLKTWFLTSSASCPMCRFQMLAKQEGEQIEEEEEEQLQQPLAPMFSQASQMFSNIFQQMSRNLPNSTNQMPALGLQADNSRPRNHINNPNAPGGRQRQDADAILMAGFRRQFGLPPPITRDSTRASNSKIPNPLLEMD